MTHHVLKGIDLEVEEGQVVCLIGASGSGKSTLLRCVNLLETVDDGTIWLDGRDISDPRVNADEVRREVGIVFQAYNLFPHMSVLANVTLGPRRSMKVSRSEAEARGLALLERFGLADKARAYPDSLSGGQQQRVAVIRAVAMAPRLLLLDEITSALDPLLVAEVLEVIAELKQDGMTIVMATHEMDFARQVADRVVLPRRRRRRRGGPARRRLHLPPGPPHRPLPRPPPLPRADRGSTGPGSVG